MSQGESGDGPDELGDIAIIGMACRFPGAPDIASFWNNLCDGVESIQHFSDAEVMAAGVTTERLHEPGYVKAGAVIEDIDKFDATFFGISPKEAKYLDPQHRLFLECTWTAMESAGYGPGSHPRATGVYAAANLSNYLLFNIMPAVDKAAGINLQILMGNDKDYLATYVSYKLDLRGPSIAVQTACSSSLVAVHLACQGLIDGQCNMAIAGGVSLNLPERAGYSTQDAVILSPDGHCRAFDAQANGTVPGDGIGVVVLKRLADAIADGDTIHAVIRGTASNNDGSAKVGFTAPSVDGQAEVIAEALAMARATPESIGYIEAHGTGTALGDMVEIAALIQVFGKRVDTPPHCALGAVKTNIGHLWTAAGIAGFIKTVLMLERRTLVPSLHFHAAHPQSSLAHSHFYVNTILQPWTCNQGVRIAGVSAFGIGGTNAHVILQEAPTITSETHAADRDLHVLALSAKSEAALRTLAKRYHEFLTTAPDLSMGNICSTASIGRAHHTHRLAVCAADLPALQAKLGAFLGAEPAVGWVTGRVLESPDPRLAFVCSGAQPPSRATLADLCEHEPVFRSTWERCEDGVRRLSGGLPAALLCTGNAPQHDSLSACATSIALAELWRSWGVLPGAVLGFGLGEYAAAAIAGSLSIEDAMFLAASHARIMEGQAGNPELTSMPYSSLDAVRRSAAMLEHSEPTIAWISSVSAQPVVSSALTKGDYWSHLWSSPIDEARVLSALPVLGYRIVLELDDQIRCSKALVESITTLGGLWCSALSAEMDGCRAVSPAVAALYVRGISIDWRAYDAHYRRRRVSLPTYPFERARHWIDPPPNNESQYQAIEGKPVHPLIGRRLRSALRERQYESAGDPARVAASLAGDLPATADVFGVALAEMMLFAACDSLSSESVILQNVIYHEHFKSDDAPLFQTIVLPEFGAVSIDVYAANYGGEDHEPQWRRLAQARASVLERTQSSGLGAGELDAARGRCVNVQMGGETIERWQSGSQVWHGSDEWLIRHAAKKGQTHIDLGALAMTFCLPSILDGMLNITPVRIAGVRMTRSLQRLAPDDTLWMHLFRNKSDATVFDLRCYDGQGTIILELLAIRASNVLDIRSTQVVQPVKTGLREHLRYMSEAQRTDQIGLFLRAQVARTIGLSDEQVPFNESMLALGVDSFSFMEVVNAVRRDLGVELTTSDFHEFASLSALSATLATRLDMSDTTASSTAPKEDNHLSAEPDSITVVAAGTLTAAAEKSAYTASLVRIQPKGHLTPLFCFHPSGGQVFVYHHLISTLGSARPIYGIQSRALNDYRLEHVSLEAMAADYVEVIRKQYPDGPYHLLGWSMGGRLAISIARLLEQSGAVVGFIGLWDSRFPTPDFTADLEEPVPGITMAYGGAMLNAIESLTPADRRAMRDTLRNASPDERLQRTILWSQERGVLPADVPFNLLFQQAALVDQHVTLLDAQTPGKVRGDLYVWWARTAMQRWPTTDWTSYTSGEVYTRFVDGDHFSMVRPPHIHILAGQLKEGLECVEQGFNSMATMQMSVGGRVSMTRDIND
ncbi:MAG: type I polyketide synthase [Gammaproteobacteria bacterium]